MPEGYQNDAMKVVVESAKVDRKGLTTMLARKHDWHDYDGIAWLLAHGADPNEMSAWGRRALHQALERDNRLAIIALLLDHGADPRLASGMGRRRWNTQCGRTSTRSGRDSGAPRRSTR